MCSPPAGTLAFADALLSGSRERSQGHVCGAAVLEGALLSWLAVYHCIQQDGICGAAVLEGARWRLCQAEGRSCGGCQAARCDGRTADALTPPVSTAAVLTGLLQPSAAQRPAGGKCHACH